MLIFTLTMSPLQNGEDTNAENTHRRAGSITKMNVLNVQKKVVSLKKAYNKRWTIENSKAIQKLRRVQKPRGTNQEHRRHRRTREQAREHRRQFD